MHLMPKLAGLASVAACMAGLMSPASAGSAYSSADIVSRFASEAEAKSLGASNSLGASRALCIGTESECAKSIPSVERPRAGFDLVVNFEYNSDTLTRPAMANLDEFAKALKDPRLDRMSFLVEGHTDAKGGDDFNLDLSARRAKSVVKYLQTRGVETAKLEAKGLGKQSPLGDPMDPANRRVETRLRAD